MEEEAKGSQEVVEEEEDAHNKIQYAEESDFEDGDFATSKVSDDIHIEERKAIPGVETVKEKSDEQIQGKHIPKIIPPKKKAPFNVELFAKECNAYMVKLERQDEQAKILH